jgi:hypothetical protein
MKPKASARGRVIPAKNMTMLAGSGTEHSMTEPEKVTWKSGMSAKSNLKWFDSSKPAGSVRSGTTVVPEYGSGPEGGELRRGK